MVEQTNPRISTAVVQLTPTNLTVMGLTVNQCILSDLVCEAVAMEDNVDNECSRTLGQSWHRISRDHIVQCFSDMSIHGYIMEGLRLWQNGTGLLVLHLITGSRLLV